MRLKSRGLGRKELIMDFREYEVVVEGDEIVVKGTIREPVNWDFSIRVCQDDLAGLAKIGCDAKMLAFLLKAALKRNKSHHWTKQRSQHIAEGRKRRRSAAAKQKRAGALPDARATSS